MNYASFVETMNTLCDKFECINIHKDNVFSTDTCIKKCYTFMTSNGVHVTFKHDDDGNILAEQCVYDALSNTDLFPQGKNYSQGDKYVDNEVVFSDHIIRHSSYITAPSILAITKDSVSAVELYVGTIKVAEFILIEKSDSAKNYVETVEQLNELCVRDTYYPVYKTVTGDILYISYEYIYPVVHTKGLHIRCHSMRVCQNTPRNKYTRISSANGNDMCILLELKDKNGAVITSVPLEESI